MLTFLTIVFAVYIIAVITLAFGWARSMEDQASTSTQDRSVAVVIPFRNESRNMPLLIENLKSLRYPTSKLTFILVDDHSDDKSTSLLSSGIAGDPRFKLLALTGSAAGKKAAIALAINHTDADIIVTTDADCRVQGEWINTIDRSFSAPGMKMLVGPVKLTDGNFFEQLQAMEFTSLVGTAGATLSYGIASMCNGANLAFKRECFVEVGGYEGNEAITSGDDDFLMKKFATRWKNSVHFLKVAEGVVVAQAAPTVSDFIRQRLRWAGKWKADFSSSSLIALAVLAFHSCNVLLISSWLFGAVSTKAFVVLEWSKLFAELMFLFQVCRFLKLPWRWSSFVALQFLYSFYVIGIGVLSQVLTTRWKGRDVVRRAWTGIS